MRTPASPSASASPHAPSAALSKAMVRWIVFSSSVGNACVRQEAFSRPEPTVPRRLAAPLALSRLTRRALCPAQSQLLELVFYASRPMFCPAEAFDYRRIGTAAPRHGLC